MKIQSDMDLIIPLDKWLWTARFYKTRTISRKMIEGGKVHYNGQRSKPSKVIEKHAIIKLRQGNDELTIKILAISDQRRGALEATALYRETQDSIC